MYFLLKVFLLHFFLIQAVRYYLNLLTLTSLNYSRTHGRNGLVQLVFKVDYQLTVMHLYDI